MLFFVRTVQDRFRKELFASPIAAVKSALAAFVTFPDPAVLSNVSALAFFRE